MSSMQDFLDSSSQMAVRLSALRAATAFLVLIYVMGRVDLRAMVRLGGLSQLSPLSNELRYLVPKSMESVSTGV
jgi:hypothetical protein